jgi:hypothetical protein
LFNLSVFDYEIRKGKTNLRSLSKARGEGLKWDGKSRVSNDLYRKNFDEIFGKKEQDELKESYEQSKRNKKERDEKNK